MSVKRQATTELNHENWDQEDPDEHEEMGTFKSATKDVLEKRVIRTAKRRVASSDETKKTVFSGFGGFNKSQPSSFDFLSKLTNGSNSTGSTDTPKSSLFSSKHESTSSLFSNKSESTSGLFSTKASPSNSGAGIFSIQTSPTSTKSTGNNTIVTGAFNTSKPDSTIAESPFKSPNVTNTSENNTSTTQGSSTPVSFGIPATTANVNKSVFSSTSTSTPFKIQPVSNASSNFSVTAKSESVSSEQKPSEGSNNDKKLNYYSKLKGLNISVSGWIKEHVDKTPLCILTPIFKDYEKYLKEIQDEFHGSEKVEDVKKTIGNDSKLNVNQEEQSTTKPVVTGGDKGSTLFGSPSSKPSFAIQNNATTEKSSTFSFGINTNKSPSSTSTTATGFSFGVTSSNSAAPTSSPFSLATNTTTNGSPSAGFSFGDGKPFSFNSNVQQPAPEKNEDANDEDDNPPKVDFTPVAEENSVYDKRCKVFVKKDGNFVDKGVGTLYLKKVEESGKHQLLIRANTNLGTILVNLILVSAIPTQRMGKNNVMMVCIPTPDAKPPPTPILIRVKTPEEADELLDTLNKYKTRARPIQL